VKNELKSWQLTEHSEDLRGDQIAVPHVALYHFHLAVMHDLIGQVLDTLGWYRVVRFHRHDN